MLKAFQNHINQNLSFLLDSKLLVAISGGLDSVVLAQLCHKTQLNFSLAHCNFNLRGNESDGDEAFVQELAEDLNVEVFIESFDTETISNNQKISTQVAARELRYNWFYELSNQFQFDYILTAHHADDNLETFLINLSRGTGLDGLTGIPEINEKTVRPLLYFTRTELGHFAEENQLKWREDSSNASTKYLRNKIRLEIIPKLKEINPEFIQNFMMTQSHLKESRNIIEDAISNVEQKIVSTDGEIIKLNIRKIQELTNSKAYLYELLKDYNFTEWHDVNSLLDAQSGKQVFSETHRLIKDRTHLLLTEIDSHDKLKSIIISDLFEEIKIPLGILRFDETQEYTDKQSNVIYVDKDLLNFPLTVRAWRKGDYFCPTGMQGKKKLSKFFKDEKYSLLEKERALVLCSKEDIIWIINKRSDDRYKVTNSTNKILKITLVI